MRALVSLNYSSGIVVNASSESASFPNAPRIVLDYVGNADTKYKYKQGESCWVSADEHGGEGNRWWQVDWGAALGPLDVTSVRLITQDSSP